MSLAVAPVKAVEIPKPGGGTRTHGVPTVAGRVAQTVAANRIETAAEEIFRADPYGYRPGRGAHDALAVARRHCWDYDWVVEFDIRKFFDGVPHDLVVRAVEGLRVSPKQNRKPSATGSSTPPPGSSAADAAEP